MIIVTQSKERIINFDNVRLIEIGQMSDKYAIYFNSDSVEGALGIYKTFSRANEVLQEFIEVLKYSNDYIVYEMPEE